MAQGDIAVTLVGNITADPELRFTPSGAAVASFTVVQNRRQLNKTTNEWEDGDPTFLRCSIWRQYAENVAETLTRGQRVMVTGRLIQRSFEKDGEKRTVYEVQADEVGVCLRYGSATFTKVARTDTNSGRGGSPADDPWTTPDPGGRPRGFANPTQPDEPPF
jgi:single-strand DNA-binding protein